MCSFDQFISFCTKKAIITGQDVKTTWYDLAWKREESTVENPFTLDFNHNYYIWELKISRLSTKDVQSCNEYELTVFQSLLKYWLEGYGIILVDYSFKS